MAWPSNVSRWIPVIQSELQRTQIPLPVDLILSTLQTESGGKPGLVNPKSGASGLMQVMPGTLDTYNKNHPKNAVTLDTLRSAEGGPEQIRVGIWVLSQYWKNAYNYLENRIPTVPVDELAHIADLMYVAGPEAVRKRLDRLSTPSWRAVQSRYPKWNALPHPKNVFARLTGIQWPINDITAWLGTVGNRSPSAMSGFALGAVMITLAWWFLSQKQNR